MSEPKPQRLSLPKRFNAALTDAAYERLNAKYHFGNNYLLTILLENLDKIADRERLEKVRRDFIAEYGQPSGGMKNSADHPDN